jgi:hypothetical protein
VAVKVGDIVELVSDLSPPEQPYWWEGKGILLSMDEHTVVLHMFFLNKISKKNFSEIYRENTMWTISIDLATSGFLKYIG